MPPRARLRWHITASVVGVVLTPVALWFLGLGTALLAPGPGGEPSLQGLWWVLGGAAVLAAVAAVSAVGSSLGLIVGGALWGLLPGALGAAGLLVPPQGSGPSRSVTAGTAAAAELLLPTGFLLVVGVVLAGAGVAVHLARRAGRHQERTEAALREAATTAERGPRPPVPPASRLRAHLVSAAAALLLLPLALLTLSRATGWLVSDEAATDGRTADPVSVTALLVAVLVLAAAMLLAASSSLGPQLAGWLMALVPGAAVIASDLTSWTWLDAPIDAVARTPGSALLVTSGFLVQLGIVTVIGGAAAHWARRAGRRLERAELALTAR